MKIIEGTELTPRVVGPVTQTDIVRFAGAGGDFNPLHHDPDFARAAGFERPIAMGQLTAGLLAAYITDWCGVERLRSFEVRFTAPLGIGRTATLRGKVLSVQDSTAVVELGAIDDLDTVLVKGTAHVDDEPAR